MFIDNYLNKSSRQIIYLLISQLSNYKLSNFKKKIPPVFLYDYETAISPRLHYSVRYQTAISKVALGNPRQYFIISQLKRQSIVECRKLGYKFFITFSNLIKLTEARTAFSFLFTSEKDFL